MKRTPAIEASLIYGISLVLSFLFFLLSFGLTKAVTLSQMTAILLLMPAWVFFTLVSYFQRKATKYGRFFGNATVVALLAVVAGILVANLPANIQGQSTVISSMNLALANFFISTMVAAAVTQFWLYRKADAKPTYAPANPSLIQKNRSSRKKKK